MKALKIIPDKKTAKKAIGTGIAAGLGMLAAKVGGAALRRLSGSIDEFAAGSDMQAAAIDIAGGVLLDSAGLLALAKVGKKAALAKKAAPVVYAGTAVAAVMPVIGARVLQAADDLLDRVLPGSASSQGSSLPASTAAPLQLVGKKQPAGFGGDYAVAGVPGGIGGDYATAGVPGGIRNAFYSPAGGVG
jgi:hypothetical protein